MDIKSQYLFIGAFVIALIGGVLLIANSQNKPEDSPQSFQETQSGEIAPHYEWYSKESLAKAQEKGRAVIYFWAVWCPTCRALDLELKEKSGELPNDVTILKTNFDTEKELKKKYKITTQHTLVEVDKEGNEVRKWIGGNVEVIKEQLK